MARASRKVEYRVEGRLKGKKTWKYLGFVSATKKDVALREARKRWPSYVVLVQAPQLRGS